MSLMCLKVKMPITKSKVTYTLNISEMIKDVPREDRAEVREQIATTVLSQILDDVSEASSPVSAQSFKPLSKDYKKKKIKEGKGGIANLEFLGDMLSSLDYRIKGNNITWGIFGDSTEKKKAENHNLGVTLPKRQFLPNDKGEPVTLGTARGNNTFRAGINNTIKSILQEASDGSSESKVND